MQFKFAVLDAFVSTAMAATCHLQNLSGLSVVAAVVSGGKTRWDLFTVDSGAVHTNDVAWFSNDQPNGNEVFTAAVGSVDNLFKFHRKNAQSIGVSGNTAGSRLLASDDIATFNVACSDCNDLASGNDLAGENCRIELTDGTNPLDLCVVFSGNAVVELQPCDDNNQNQNIAFFSHD
ncbi:hypothetical protein C8R43DRAFT_1177740 [Mycena crocata]|nr:hypothetical protein C8R43DRAFT_1177740 [Mycena crocata]